MAIDQRALPWRESWLQLRSAEAVAQAIRGLAIRGAPLIGVAAAYGVAIELQRSASQASLDAACQLLLSTRPTAVNLAHAVARVRGATEAAAPAEAATAALQEAQAIEYQEEQASRVMADLGADLLKHAGVVLTHCNTGFLAAPGRGTALAVIAELHERGGLRRVIATESRPLLQGARLTAYELDRLGVPHEVIVDSAAAAIIAGPEVDAVVVGCDRVAANGDVANKVGTFGLALAARAAAIPFLVVGPVSTIDPDCPSGDHIAIEERSPDEVRIAAGVPLTPEGTAVRNPAFDVTPAELVTALVTERGAARPPSAETISRLTGP